MSKIGDIIEKATLDHEGEIVIQQFRIVDIKEELRQDGEKVEIVITEPIA